MNRQSPGLRSLFSAFFTGRAASGVPAAAVGRKRRLRNRALSAVSAIALGLGLMVPASLALGASPASAATASCTADTNCAVTGVNFLEAGNYNFSGVQVCGIENDYAPLASAEVDLNYDDTGGLFPPLNLGGASLPRTPGNDGGGMTEGNYTASEAFQFAPAPGTTLGGSTSSTQGTITVSLPHPAEPYSNSGSTLPPDQVPSNAVSEQFDSTVTGPSSATNSATVTVTLSYGPNIPLGNKTVRLDAFDPYNPPSLASGPGPNVSGGGTSASIAGTYTGNESKTNSSGVATFTVTDTAKQAVVFGATDVTSGSNVNWVGIIPTATIYFNGASQSPPSTAPCQSEVAAPHATATDACASGQLSCGLTWLVIVNNFGYLVSSVTANSASGVETATLTVPADAVTEEAQNPGSPITVVALDATSPPGQGTPDNKLTGSDTPYAPDAFSISTSQDPVPAHPTVAPVFQADFAKSIPNYPVDGSMSTLTSSAASTQVGSSNNNVNVNSVTATATLRDYFNNPVNNKLVSIFQCSTAPCSPTHAAVTPVVPPVSPAVYPATANDGTVSYSVSDSCAETVLLEAADLSDNVSVGPPGAQTQLPVTFTPGPPVAPDGTTTPANCGVPTVTSSVTVNGSPVSASQVDMPVDGQATVNVTLGDQFGNADACQHVILAATANTSHATITPKKPANPAALCDTPGYTGSDGEATFVVSDATAESVVLGVTDLTIPTAWPTNPVTNFMDVAQIKFEGVNASQSTVTASPASAPADGQPTATVTVTLKDGDGQPVPNQTVTLTGCANDPDATSTSPPPPSCTPDTTTTITPSTAVTDSNGQATFDVSDSSPGTTVSYQATSDGITVAQDAPISFTPGGVSLSASPASVVADGTGTSTVTFTLTYWNTSTKTITPVPGAAVSLAASPSALATISPASATTDSNGQATFTVSDTQAGPVSLEATGTYSLSVTRPSCVGMLSGTTCTVTASAKVSFIGKPSAFSIIAAPATGIPADGASPSQVTVTALDKNGNPIAGLPVSLSANSSTASISASNPVTNSYGQVLTNGSGQATFTVTDTAPETVTVNASYQEIGQLSGTLHSAPGSATIQFVPTEAQASAVTASPASAPADGSSAVTVTVTLQSGSPAAPINGHSVVLYTGSATTTVVPGNLGGVTGISAPGQVSFTITDTRPETLMVYARDQNTGVIITQMPTITFLPTEVQLSTVTASPVTLAAGGPLLAPSTSTVTVTLSKPIPATCSQQALSGHTVKLTSDSGSASISAPAVTDSNGVATFTVSDPVVETVTLTAVDATCGVTLEQTATVNFVATEANQSTVTISPVSTPADGPAATLTVTLKSATGAPISGRTVTVPAVAHATVTPLAYPGLAAGVTNASGQAQFAVSDNTVEDVTLVAYDGTTELDQAATVSFTADEANQSTLSATATSLPALGASTAVTVTLISGGGAPIAGHSVLLLASSPTVSITPATVTTNSAGQAQFTVSDPVAESVVLSALDQTSGVGVVQTLPVTFAANEQNQSTATASPTVVQVRKTSTITVTLLGASDQPLAGHAVMLNTGSTSTTVTVLTPGGVTTATGQIQFSVTDKAAETLSITVTDTTAGVTLYRPVTLTFTKP